MLRLLRRLALLALATGALLVIYAAYVVAGLPPRTEVKALARNNPARTRLMLQREDESRRSHRKARFQQTFVPLKNVSRNLLSAVVVAEDPKFFGHGGVDWEAIKESFETDVKKGAFFRGGSTITQQLAKNLFFTTEKSITRKIRELVVTRWLEEDLSKRRILELYLNVIEWGDGVYGCEAGAKSLYGKSASDLDPNEAAGLAAMIPSPRHINPSASPARFSRAQRRILWLMAHEGYVKQSVAGLGTLPPPEPPEDAGAPAGGAQSSERLEEEASPSAEP